MFYKLCHNFGCQYKKTSVATMPHKNLTHSYKQVKYYVTEPKDVKTETKLWMWITPL